jgi:hypothetical protein
VPTEMPDSEDIRRKRQTGWVPTRTQMALMLVACFSGYVHWPLFYLILLALAWVSLEADRRLGLGLSLRWDFAYWISIGWTTALFLLAPFEAGRLVSLIDEYFHS